MSGSHGPLATKTKIESKWLLKHNCLQKLLLTKFNKTSATGDAFLVATGSSQIKVYDRDGKERGVSVAGDMYIRDLRNTKGHISPCTHAQWHPTDRYTGMTSSDDGSIRVWDTWNVLQKTVIKPQLAKPGRIAVTACAYNHDGGLIGGGMFDGTLQIWDVKGMLRRPQHGQTA